MPYQDRSTEDLIATTARTCADFGARDLIALWGVPGTGKTFVAKSAAERVTGHSRFVKRVQFHQSYNYEDFVEGLRPTPGGGFDVKNGLFLDWNDQAHLDGRNRYVLLIEELSRANVSAVLGELLTFMEYRSTPFETPVSRRNVTVAPNLVVLATMNPRDRSAIELDDAILRRMRVIECPPSLKQLEEMLGFTLPAGHPDRPAIIKGCKDLFAKCQEKMGDRFAEYMPFGHGVFAGIRGWDDVSSIWDQKLRPLLFRPNVPHDEIAQFIRENYPRKPAA